MSSILITLPSGIGDAIQSLVGLRIIEEFFPSSTIVVLVEPNIQGLLSGHFSKNVSFLSNRSLSFFQNKQEFDVLVDFNGLPLLHAKLASHRYKKIITHTCFVDPAIKEGADCIYVDNSSIINTPFFEARGHEPKMAWTLYAKMANLLLPNDVQLLHFNMESLLRTRVSKHQKIKPNRNSVVAIFPGGSSKDKHWPISKYLKLIELLIRSGFEVRVFIGKKELCYMKHFSRKGCCVVFNKRIDKLIELNADLDFAISNDTGLMHIIGALGIGLLGIFLDTTPQSWFTYNGNKQGYITKKYSNCRRYQTSSSVFDVFRYAKFLSQRSITSRVRNKQFKKLGRNITIRS